MKTLDECIRMIQGLFPSDAVIDGSMEMNKYDIHYGVAVALEKGGGRACLRPEQLMAIKEAMKATYFGMYPSIPIGPYDIRIYFYISVPYDEKEA